MHLIKHEAMMSERNIAVFFGRDLVKIQFATKYLAARMIVEPLIVHAFVRNGRDISGKIINKSHVKALTSTLVYLKQSTQTFEAINTMGRLIVHEVPQNMSEEDCLKEIEGEVEVVTPPVTPPMTNS